MRRIGDNTIINYAIKVHFTPLLWKTTMELSDLLTGV